MVRWNGLRGSPQSLVSLESDMVLRLSFWAGVKKLRRGAGGADVLFLAIRELVAAVSSRTAAPFFCSMKQPPPRRELERLQAYPKNNFIYFLHRRQTHCIMYGYYQSRIQKPAARCAPRYTRFRSWFPPRRFLRRLKAAKIAARRYYFVDMVKFQCYHTFKFRAV
jgi:hypothetical protein